MPRFWSPFSKISILEKNFGKDRFSLNSRKFQVWSEFPKNIDFIRNLSILVQIYENLDFGFKKLKNLVWSHNFRNISIWAKIFEKLNFREYFRNISILITVFENLDFGKIIEKSPFWPKFSINIDFGQISKNLN